MLWALLDYSRRNVRPIHSTFPPPAYAIPEHEFSHVSTS